MYLQMLLGLDGMHVWQEQPTIMAMRSWKCFERCYTHSPIQTDRDTQALLLAAQIAQIMSWSYVLFSLRCQTACYSADAMEDHLLLGIVLSSLLFFLFSIFELLVALVNGRVNGQLGKTIIMWPITCVNQVEDTVLKDTLFPFLPLISMNLYLSTTAPSMPYIQQIYCSTIGRWYGIITRFAESALKSEVN